MNGGFYCNCKIINKHFVYFVSQIDYLHSAGGLVLVLNVKKHYWLRGRPHQLPPKQNSPLLPQTVFPISNQLIYFQTLKIKISELKFI